MNVDKRLTRYFASQSTREEKFWCFVTNRGLFILGIILFGIWAGQGRVCMGFVGLGTVLISVLLSTGLQALFQRPRPCETLTHYALRFRTYSFPSTHTTASFAFVVSIVIGTQPYAQPMAAIMIAFALLFALLVALSRVKLGVHYLSDLLGGMLLGGVIALSFFHIWFSCF